MFKEVTKAYSVLGNASEKAEYDMELDREERIRHMPSGAQHGMTSTQREVRPPSSGPSLDPCVHF